MCKDDNLCINVEKTKEVIVDFRKTKRRHPPPICIGGAEVEVVSSYKYLGVHINDDLKWKSNCNSLVKKAHQWLYFLRRLKKAGLGTTVLHSNILYNSVVWKLLCNR